MIIELKDEERLDDLQRNGYQIIQKKDGFCFGMDAVLLSGFAAVKPGEKAIWEPGRELSRFFWKRNMKANIIRVWRFRMRWRRWPRAVWRSITWKRRSRS